MLHAHAVARQYRFHELRLQHSARAERRRARRATRAATKGNRA